MTHTRRHAELLQRLAGLCGIQDSYHDIWGTLHPTRPETAQAILAGMGFGTEAERDLQAAIARLEQIQRDAAAAPPSPGPTSLPHGHGPQTGFLPPALHDEGRIWGVNFALYGIRSDRNWGVGDFEDLRAAVLWAADLGADFAGLLPLHTLHNEEPHGISPYYPSSRLFLNPLYIAVDRVPEAQDPRTRQVWEDPAFQARLAALRGTSLVDYPGAWECKRRILDICHQVFRETHLPGAGNPTSRGAAFLAWRANQGEVLQDFCRFAVLRERARRDPRGGPDWRHWPVEWRTPQAARSLDDAGELSLGEEFEAYLQWLAAEQLALARRAGLDRGMALGLYTDLALGVDPCGADAWVYQDVLARDTSAGAPPDPFSLLGQRWGVPPVIPFRHRQSGYRFFLETLGRNAARSDALRIDHVMALWRLYWAPDRLPASAGAYVRDFPEDLLPLARSVSQEEHCLVVGEDLGTVPPEVRADLGASGFFSYRLLIFEKTHEGHYRRPGEYPRQSLVAVATHDLPPLDGFWTGRDLEVKRALERYPSEEVARADADTRGWDRLRLLEALAAEALLPGDVHPCHEPPAAWLDDLAAAVHGFLARTPSALLLVNLEDLLGEREMQNLPGTLTEHPNWKRKYEVPLERWRDTGRTHGVAEIIHREGRGRGCNGGTPRVANP